MSDNSMPHPTSRAEAFLFDQKDRLSPIRSQFHLPDGVTYLVGHSLGPAPKTAINRLQQVAETEWANGMVRSWNDADWIDLPKRVGRQIAPLLGVDAEDVIVCDNVSVNLFKLAAAVLMRLPRKALLIEATEFPTDQYVAKGLSDLSGADLIKLAPEDSLAALSKGGVMIKSAVNFRSSEVVDIAAYEQAAAASGAMIIWDVSHGTGVVELDLARKGAKLATGCTYKYLNGGPGAPAFIYASKTLAGQLQPPLCGWLGHSRPFDFSGDYEPAVGVERFTAGTPGILSLSALSSSLTLFENICVSDLHRKAQSLGDLCTWRAEQLGLKVASPCVGDRRGGHVSFRHEEGYAVSQALAARGILTDFRTPDTIRLGLSPLFLRYVDIWDAMDQLEDIMVRESWVDLTHLDRALVT